MFTGLIEEIGVVAAADKKPGGCALAIGAKRVLEDLHVGDSIAVNGVCLTATRFDDESFRVDLSPETIRRTNLGDLSPGDPVNLERALKPAARMGGHFVQGHVDGTGAIKEMRPDGDALWLTVETEPALMRYVAVKGFIAIDGVSLTVCQVGPDWFDLTLVPHTRQNIALPRKNPGARVNLEVDILAKYVERLLQHGADAGPDAAIRI
jgi:riboflavin synthase